MHIIECDIIVRIGERRKRETQRGGRGGSKGGTYKLRNCKLLGYIATYPDEGHSIYTRSRVYVRSCIPREITTKMRGKTVHTGRPGPPNSNCRVCIRAKYLFHPYTRTPAGRYHCLIKFKNYFLSSNIYIYPRVVIGVQRPQSLCILLIYIWLRLIVAHPFARDPHVSGVHG